MKTSATTCLAAAFFALLAGCQTLPTAGAEHDGTRCRNAVVVNADSERGGEQAEYAWLGRHFQAFKPLTRVTARCDGKIVHIVTVQTADGHKSDIFFDIGRFHPGG
ncbi:MAG: hypothetical protein PVJ40_06830 [Gammaproteobacteria bacterium]